MSASISICSLCAWRATCQKKFSISGRDMRCPDFVKDLTIKETGPEKVNSEHHKGGTESDDSKKE